MVHQSFASSSIIEDVTGQVAREVLLWRGESTQVLSTRTELPVPDSSDLSYTSRMHPCLLTTASGSCRKDGFLESS